MIPKKIHYVWLGRNPKNKVIKRAINTWKKHLSEYEIIEWNEDNFDLTENKFIAEAYRQKKWAFVSDYVRAKAIYEQGGIYLDTDVLVLDDLTQFLNNKSFVGFENDQYPFTAVFGAEKGHPLIKDMVDMYEDVDFDFDTNDQLKSVNTKSVSDLLINKYGVKIGGQEQDIDKLIHVYPAGVLCNPSAKSSAIHIFTGTWMDGGKGWRRNLITFIKSNIRTKAEANLYQKLISK